MMVDSGSSRISRKPRHWAKLLLGSVGLVLFVYLILRIGIGTVIENLSHFGIWFLPVLFIGALWLFLQACAWSIIQNTFFKKVPFWKLFKVRIIADAFNSLSSASLGGDAARAYLIRKDVPLKEGIPAVPLIKPSNSSPPPSSWPWAFWRAPFSSTCPKA